MIMCYEFNHRSLGIYMNQSLTKHSESDILIAIENFVISLGMFPFNEQKFKCFIQEYSPLFQSIYQPDYDYFQSVLFFQELVGYVENMLNGLSNLSRVTLTTRQITSIVELVNNNKIDISKKVIGLRGQEQDNKKSLLNYITQLTQHYSKLLFIRIDLSILKEHQPDVDIRQFNDYLAIFLNRIQNKDTCFKDLQGYAWAIEQGDSKGYHCHALLIYDGHKHQNDFGLALQIGHCWKNITQQKGHSFTSNSPDYKKQFAEKGTLGIGMIHRSQPEQVQNAIQAAMYLVNPEKDNQHLRGRVKRMHSFGRGEFANKKRIIRLEPIQA